MAEVESNIKPTLPSKTAKTMADGFTAPIEHSGEGKLPDHIDPLTLMAKGYDPNEGLVTVSLQVLKKQHGEKKGTEMYKKIAVAGGFFDPQSEPTGSDFLPDLSLEGMDKDARARVDAVLEGK